MVAFYRPTTLADALEIRAQHRVTVIAGCTDIYPARTGRAAWGDPVQEDVLDLTAVPGLRHIEETADGFRFGSLVTWTDLVRAPLPPQFDGYKLSAREIGGVQVQNRGTLVGNICTASPAGDGLPNLLVLEAEVELASTTGTRRVPVAAFVDGYRHTQCGSDEIVTALIIPRLAGMRSHFRKLGARRYLVISIAMVAGLVATDAQGRVTTARIAVGSCSAVAQRMTAMEAGLLGVPLAQAGARVRPEHLDALVPIDDIRGSAAYRREAALVLTRDLLAALASDSTRRVA
jgi:xanthine dehydrogenase small subunit